jgi:FMN phosphatase YigB (HAD superfamily)
MMGRIRAVVFDAGETLVDETRAWTEWTYWLGVDALTFLGTLGGVIARGEHHHRVFELFSPSFDLADAREARRRAGRPDGFLPQDLYPDARPCLEKLRGEGYAIGIAGNYGVDTEAMLRDLDLPVDFVGSSARWGAEKPSGQFFRNIVESLSLASEDIAYVGDRLDKDVVGAAEAGFVPIWLIRGPWALLQRDHPYANRAALRIRSLDELPAALGHRDP